jgi:hypothetical protein
MNDNKINMMSREEDFYKDVFHGLRVSWKSAERNSDLLQGVNEFIPRLPTFIVRNG